MRLNFFILLVLLSWPEAAAWAQSPAMQGEVVNAKTREPVAYANIWIKPTDIRQTSNQDGKFILAARLARQQDTLVFSAIGFKSLVIPVRQLLQTATPVKQILLQEDVFALQQVLVRPLTARQIVAKGVEHLAQNHGHAPYLVKGFYRKAIKENDAFATLLESVVQVRDAGSNKPWAQVAYLKSRVSQDYRKYKQALEPDVMARALELDHVRYQRGFLNAYNLDSWQFKLTDPTSLHGKQVYVIQAVLAGRKPGAGHQARIYIRAEDFAFQRIDYDYSWESADLPDYAAPWDTLIFKKYRWKGSFNYIPFRGKMVLNYFHFVLSQQIYARKFIEKGRSRVEQIQLAGSQESHEEFIADDIQQAGGGQSLAPARTATRFSDSASPYDALFWESYGKPVDSKLFLSIKKDLEQHGPLEQLFIKDSP